VNFELLPNYLGQKVLLVGEVQGSDKNTVTLRAADGGTVVVALTTGNAVFDTQFVGELCPTSFLKVIWERC
jgi:hypothetical protein